MNEFTVNSGSSALTVAGATTLVFVNPPAAPNVNLEIMRCWVSFSANATSAQQRVAMVTQVSAFPTLTSATPAKLKPAGPASVITGGTAGAAGTAGINASAEGAGGKTTVIPDTFNSLIGWLWVATPREGIVMPAGSTSGFGLFFPVPPSTLAGWACGVNYAEV